MDTFGAFRVAARVLYNKNRWISSFQHPNFNAPNKAMDLSYCGVGPVASQVLLGTVRRAICLYGSRCFLKSLVLL